MACTRAGPSTPTRICRIRGRSSTTRPQGRIPAYGPIQLRSNRRNLSRGDLQAEPGDLQPQCASLATLQRFGILQPELGKFQHGNIFKLVRYQAGLRGCGLHAAATDDADGQLHRPMEHYLQSVPDAQAGRPFSISTPSDLTGDNFIGQDRPAFATSAYVPANLVTTSFGSFD